MRALGGTFVEAAFLFHSLGRREGACIKMCASEAELNRARGSHASLPRRAPRNPPPFPPRPRWRPSPNGLQILRVSRKKHTPPHCAAATGDGISLVTSERGCAARYGHRFAAVKQRPAANGQNSPLRRTGFPTFSSSSLDHLPDCILGTRIAAGAAQPSRPFDGRADGQDRTADATSEAGPARGARRARRGFLNGTGRQERDRRD